jgi:hypothetical protein
MGWLWLFGFSRVVGVFVLTFWRASDDEPPALLPDASSSDSGISSLFLTTFLFPEFLPTDESTVLANRLFTSSSESKISSLFFEVFLLPAFIPADDNDVDLLLLEVPSSESETPSLFDKTEALLESRVVEASFFFVSRLHSMFASACLPMLRLCVDVCPS